MKVASCLRCSILAMPLACCQRNNMCRILQHVVNGFDNVSLAQHHSVIEGHQLIFHVYAQPCHQLYSILKEEVK